MEVTKENFADAAARLEELLPSASFVAFDEEMTGIQLNAIKPGSLFAQAGLQDGDVVTSLNGIAANSPEGSQKLLQEFRTSDEWTLVVRDRNGNERTLDFERD